MSDIGDRLREYHRADPYRKSALMAAEAADEIESLSSRLADAERDAERLDWIEANLIEGKWDGTIGRPKSWHMVGPYRHELQKLRGDNLREAIDAAMEQSHE